MVKEHGLDIKEISERLSETLGEIVTEKRVSVAIAKLKLKMKHNGWLRDK